MTRAARFQPLLLRCALRVACCASIAAAHVARISTCIIGANYVTSTGWVIAGSLSYGLPVGKVERIDA